MSACYNTAAVVGQAWFRLISMQLLVITKAPSENQYSLGLDLPLSSKIGDTLRGPNDQLLSLQMPAALLLQVFLYETSH